MTARAELTGTRDRAREMLLAQGAELSRASIALSQIFDRLEAYGPLLLEVKYFILFYCNHCIIHLHDF